MTSVLTPPPKPRPIDQIRPRAEWPDRPAVFGPVLTPTEAAQYLRLDETGAHTPISAIRTLNYFRDRGELRATKYARRVWYRREELERFLETKTQS
jgi:helix-turn-helix protein